LGRRIAARRWNIELRAHLVPLGTTIEIHGHCQPALNGGAFLYVLDPSGASKGARLHVTGGDAPTIRQGTPSSNVLVLFPASSSYGFELENSTPGNGDVLVIQGWLQP
jgi:hypothetical protein